MITSGSLVISLSILFGFHMYLIFTNKSTLEMGELLSNPFNRVKKVFKSQADKRIRDPVRLFVGNIREKKTARSSEMSSNNQMKEVTAFI